MPQPQSLDEYLALVNPSESPDAKRQRLSEAMAVAGLSMLGTPKGREWQGVGRAGLLGIANWNQSERDRAAEALRLMTARHQAMQAYQLERQMRGAEAYQTALPGMVQAGIGGGAPPGAAQTPSYPQSTLSQFQMPPETRGSLNNVLADPTNTLPPAGFGPPPPLNTPPAPPAQKAGPYEKLMAMADYLEQWASKQTNPEAQALALKNSELYREQALKFRNKNQSMQTVLQNGKEVLIQPTDFGAPYQLPYDPVKKTHYLDRGGVISPINEYTSAAAGADIPKTMTYSDRLARERLNFDQTNKKTETPPGEKEAFTKANTLRDELNKLSTPYITVRDGYRRVQSAYESAKTDKSGAADIAIIFGYMKTLDPGSTVREGEAATVQNSGGVPDWVRVKYNQAINGEKLSPDMRDNILKASTGLHKKAEESYKHTVEQYRKLAIRNKVNPDDVIVEHRINDAPQPSGVLVKNADGTYTYVPGGG